VHLASTDDSLLVQALPVLLRELTRHNISKRTRDL
jgi:hypothetical protein